MKKAVLLFGILLLPTLIYIYFALGVPQVRRAAFYGPRAIGPVKNPKTGVITQDTVYHSIKPFVCKTHEGFDFSSAKLGGRSYLAVFMHPDSIRAVLPILAQDLKVNKRTHTYSRFVFFWPEDTLQAAPDLAGQLGLGTDTGYTLVLPPAEYQAMRDGQYFLPNPTQSKKPYATLSDAVLIDRMGRIRGYYNIRYAADIKKMKEDLRHVLFRDESVKTIEETKVEQRR
ncbi:MAG: hypothetical protein LW750_03840 [Bacteroidetes bacterium]|jgi:hypothetical protein|nr:hypothetical protein [Bacteroidota bacterium]